MDDPEMPNNLDPNVKTRRGEGLDKLRDIITKKLATYPWSKWVANIKAYWDEGPATRIKLNYRFGLQKPPPPSPPYVMEVMEKGSPERDNAVITIPLNRVGSSKSQSDITLWQIIAICSFVFALCILFNKHK